MAGDESLHQLPRTDQSHDYPALRPKQRKKIPLKDTRS